MNDWHFQPLHPPTDLILPIAQVPAITGAETRMYYWLLKKHWSKVSQRVVELGRLHIDFAGPNQLVVSWNGDPGSRRRTVLVAHVDREGYLVKSIDKSGNKFVLEARNLNESLIEEERDQTRVVVSGGCDRQTFRTYGQIRNINMNLAGEKQPGSVLIELDETIAPQVCSEHETGLVSIH